MLNLKAKPEIASIKRSDSNWCILNSTDMKAFRKTTFPDFQVGQTRAV
jgi:hypothetical protein